MTEVSLVELSQLQDEIIEINSKADSLRNAQKALAEVLYEKERRMILMMTDAKLTNFRTANGQIVLNKRFSVQTPKGDDLDSFFAGLDPDTRKALATVNPQTLNSWYKVELEKARDRGDIDWCPQGLKPPTVNEYLAVKK